MDCFYYVSTLGNFKIGTELCAIVIKDCFLIRYIYNTGLEYAYTKNRSVPAAVVACHWYVVATA